MEVVLFDTSPIRRDYWQKACSNRSLSLECFESYVEPVKSPDTEPRVIVLSLSVLNDRLTGKRLLENFPFDAVAFVVSGDEVSSASKLMRAGADWVFDFADEQEAIEKGLSYLVRDAGERNALAIELARLKKCSAALTTGERAVVELVIEGVPNKAIATQLAVSVRTVESRRSRAYVKCGVTSISELVRFFDRKEELKQFFAKRWCASLRVVNSSGWIPIAITPA